MRTIIALAERMFWQRNKLWSLISRIQGAVDVKGSKKRRTEAEDRSGLNQKPWCGRDVNFRNSPVPKENICFTRSFSWFLLKLGFTFIDLSIPSSVAKSTTSVNSQLYLLISPKSKMLQPLERCQLKYFHLDYGLWAPLSSNATPRIDDDCTYAPRVASPISQPSRNLWSCRPALSNEARF